MAMEWLDNGCKARKGYWITGDGILKKLTDMSPEHIRNCIDYIWTYGGKLREFEHDKIDEFEKELIKRDTK